MMNTIGFLELNSIAKGVEVAANLMISGEFQARNLSNEAFVKVVYRALLGRDADPSGLATWTEKLDGGMTRAVCW